jgi:hypothetical protein
MPALPNPAILANDPPQALELTGELPVEIDNFIECLRDVGIDALEIIRQANRKVSAPERSQRGQNLTAVELGHSVSS